MGVIDCKGCGAPLDVASGARVVVCQYCKAQNQVATSTPSVHVHMLGTAPAPMPISVPPPVADDSPHVARSSGRGAGGVVALVLAFIGAGVALAVAFAIQSGVTGGGLFGPSYSWSALGACWVDANGDGVDDIAGLTGPPGESFIPTIVNGITGDVLWRGEDAGEGAKLECLDRQWLVVGKPDFELRILDVKKPDAPISLRGRDQLQVAAVGKGCAALKTADGSVLGVALPAGTKTECAAEFRGPFDTPGIIGLTGEETQLTVGERRYVLTKRRSGTSILTLRIEEKGKVVLEKELPYAAATFASGMAVAGDRIVIFGARPAQQDEGMLVGLDAKTGAELYAVKLEGQVTHGVEAMAYNGRYVVLQFWTYLRAYDPATGEQVW